MIGTLSTFYLKQLLILSGTFKTCLFGYLKGRGIGKDLINREHRNKELAKRRRKKEEPNETGKGLLKKEGLTQGLKKLKQDGISYLVS